MANPTDTNTPQDSDPAKGAAEELRTLKLYLQNLWNPGTGIVKTIFALLGGDLTQTFQAHDPVSGQDVVTKAYMQNQFTIATTANDKTISILGGFLIVKFGTRAAAVDGAAIVFDTPFPTACFGAIAQDSGLAAKNGAGAFAANQFVYYSDHSGNPMHFIAFGN